MPIPRTLGSTRAAPARPPFRAAQVSVDRPVGRVRSSNPSAPQEQRSVQAGVALTIYFFGRRLGAIPSSFIFA
jgi:hypothetical protein